MFNRLSIRNKMIVGILAGCLLPYLVGSLIIRNKTEEWLYQNYVDTTGLVLKQSAEYIDDSVLHQMETLISALVLDDRIINAGTDIQSYVNYVSGASLPAKSEKEKQIEAVFRSIMQEGDVISYISYGNEEGGYVEYPTFHPSSPYDPRVRGWYKNAINRTGAVISEPYETQVTRDLVISVDKRVVKGNEKIGVVSLTISLNNIRDYIANISYDKIGSICIISPSNVFISSPKNKDWLLKSTTETGAEVFDGFEKFDGSYFEGRLDGVEKIFTVYISPGSGWKYISIIDKSTLLNESKALSAMLSLILLITYFLIIALVIIISSRITKPITKLTQIIKKMAGFQFDAYEHKDFKAYIHQTGEIGDISRALSGMQDNFIELKHKVKTVDAEIQKIDINDPGIHQISLSADNPFSGIAGAVNGLLKKVDSYIDQIKMYNDEIQFLAEHDPLTNLPNRRSFHAALASTLSAGIHGAILLLDIDNFKSINDTLGHLYGDKVLQYVSERLCSTGTPEIMVSRFGGDEFLILFRYSEEKNDVEDYTRQIFDLFKHAAVIDDNEVSIEFSIGITYFPQDSINMGQLIMNADLALHEAKVNGKNKVTFFNKTLEDRLRHKINMKKILVHAMENDGLKMVYQPQINLRTGKIQGYEALVRLKEHNISPSEFIAAAEENGLILSLGRMVTKLVVRQLAEWNHKGLRVRPVSINFSALQINDIGYKAYLLDLLEEYCVNPNWIVIEITENAFMENREVTISFIRDLKEQGIRFAIDDFGTQYSSLSYIAFLPIDTLKTDRDLNYKFMEFDNDEVMRSLITFIHSLNLKIIAEGIEDIQEARKLMEADCDSIQGYCFSRPLEAEDVPKNMNRIFKI